MRLSYARRVAGRPIDIAQEATDVTAEARDAVVAMLFACKRKQDAERDAVEARRLAELWRREDEMRKLREKEEARMKKEAKRADALLEAELRKRRKQDGDEAKRLRASIEDRLIKEAQDEDAEVEARERMRMNQLLLDALAALKRAMPRNGLAHYLQLRAAIDFARRVGVSMPKIEEAELRFKKDMGVRREQIDEALRADGMREDLELAKDRERQRKHLTMPEPPSPPPIRPAPAPAPVRPKPVQPKRVVTASLPICFQSHLAGPDIEVLQGGSAVRKTAEGHAFAFAGPLVPRHGNAHVTFRLEDPNAARLGSCAVGLFPADEDLDGDIWSTEGKRCALQVMPGGGGSARVLCDGKKSDDVTDLSWVLGDTVNVHITSEGDTACVTTRFKGRTEERTLKDIPACGLRFGAGLRWEGEGVTLVASALEAEVEV